MFSPLWAADSSNCRTAVSHRRARGAGAGSPAPQGGGGLLEQPGVAEAAPADHGHVAPVYCRMRTASSGSKHIPVGDDRDGHRLLYRPDVVPVGPAGVHLGLVRPWTATAATPACSMALANSTQLMEPLSQPRRNLTVTGPAARPPDHRLGHPDRQVGVRHQARAVPGVGHLGHRAAHVDVDDVRPRPPAMAAACSMQAGSLPKSWTAAGAPLPSSSRGMDFLS